MSTATESETDVLGALDFTPSLPCEHSQHGEFHPGDQAAEFVAEYACRACGDSGRYLICGPGRAFFLDPSDPYTTCRVCRAEDLVSRSIRFWPIVSTS